MTTEQMRTFLAVADCLNFTKAAERLYLSQPTISRQVQALEEECRTPLLVRTRKEVRLTPAGAIMVSHLKNSLSEIEAGLEEIQASSNGITGKLNIGVLEGFESDHRVLAPLVEFGKQYSELTVNINYCSFGELRRGLNDGTFDLIFTMGFEAKNLPSTLSRKLCQLSAGIIVCANSALGERTDLTIYDLRDETFIAPDEKDSPFRLEDTNDVLNHYGFPCKKMGNNKKSIGFGARGWLLIIVLFFGFMMFQVFTNYPFTQQALWSAVYLIENVVVTMYALFFLSIIAGQWFPTRKGTVMGIATIAYPVSNGVIGFFAASVMGPLATGGMPAVFKGFLPFLVLTTIGYILFLIFVTDYPEQCGAYRDNDKNITPEVAKQMLEEEIRNKQTTVWTTGHIFKTRDFWFTAVSCGLLLMGAVGTMTQSNAIISAFPELNYTIIMMMVAIFGAIGSWKNDR